MARCPSSCHTTVPAFALLLAALLFSASAVAAESDRAGPRYVGSAVCRDCHEVEYDRFVTYAKKSRSFESIEKMRKGLTSKELEKCFFCHTTGYGRPGGFVSVAETPQLRNAGCEVCHGPGGRHVKTRDRRDIKGKLTMEDCEICHTSERVRAFRFKPLIHGGAH